MRRFLRRTGAWLLTGLVLGALTAAVTVGLYTRTTWGRAHVLGYTLQALGGRLNGELTVERLDGNVLTGARLYTIRVRGNDGTPLLRADSAFIEYKLPTFVGGDVLINRLTVYDAELYLQRLPGDSLWNYQEVLLDTTRTQEGPGRATMIEWLRVERADVTVRLPWEPTRRLSERRKRREIELALADTARLIVERVPGGLMQTMTFRVDRGEISELYIASDERGGTYLRVDSAQGEARLWRNPPLEVRDLSGELALHDGMLRYRAPRVRLPSSTLETAGTVDLREERPRYDLVFAGEDIAFADMQWFYPRFPDRGGGGVRLWVETHDNDALFLRARELRVQAPGTRLVGEFGLLLGDTVRFLDVDLRAEPLDVRTVERMLPTELPVRGLRIGAVVVETPAS